MTSVLLGIIFFVVSYIFAEPLIRVFSDQDADLIAISVSCMRYYSPAYFIMGIGIPLGIYFQAIENPIKAFMITFSHGILYPVLLGILLPLLTQQKEMLWVSIPIAEALTAILSVVLYFVSRHASSHHDIAIPAHP